MDDPSRVQGKYRKALLTIGVVVLLLVATSRCAWSPSGVGYATGVIVSSYPAFKVKSVSPSVDLGLASFDSVESSRVRVRMESRDVPGLLMDVDYWLLPLGVEQRDAVQDGVFSRHGLSRSDAVRVQQMWKQAYPDSVVWVSAYSGTRFRGPAIVRVGGDGKGVVIKVTPDRLIRLPDASQ